MGTHGKVAELLAARSLSIRPKSIEAIAIQLAPVLNVDLKVFCGRDPRIGMNGRSCWSFVGSILLSVYPCPPCRQLWASECPYCHKIAGDFRNGSRRTLPLGLRFQLAAEVLGQSEQ